MTRRQKDKKNTRRAMRNINSPRWVAHERARAQVDREHRDTLRAREAAPVSTLDQAWSLALRSQLQAWARRES